MNDLKTPKKSLAELFEQLNKETCIYDELCSKFEVHSDKINNSRERIETAKSSDINGTLISHIEFFINRINLCNQRLSSSLINIEEVYNL
jgi:hypothetical protein